MASILAELGEIAFDAGIAELADVAGFATFDEMAGDAVLGGAVDADLPAATEIPGAIASIDTTLPSATGVFTYDTYVGENAVDAMYLERTIAASLAGGEEVATVGMEALQSNLAAGGVWGVNRVGVTTAVAAAAATTPIWLRGGNDEEEIPDSAFFDHDPDGFPATPPPAAGGSSGRTGRAPNASGRSSLINSSYNMSLPHHGTKKRRGAEISTNASKKKKKVSVRMTPAAGEERSHTFAQQERFYDSHLLVNTGEKRLTRLNVKLGNAKFPNTIGPFLKNLLGKGQLRMQFAGRCVSEMGKRHNHCQMFRHRLSSADGLGYNPNLGNDMPYDPLFRNHILYPANTTTFYPSGNNTGASFAPGNIPLRDITTNETYWAPYNLADLEDCSWNLNSLKLIPPNWNVAGTVAQICDQVEVGQANQHYRASYLANNNSTGIEANSPSFYRYKAVINKGALNYVFMNKGTGGAKVEIIIYRVKKNQKIDWDIAMDYIAPDTAMNFFNSALSTPIGEGYLNTMRAKGATDNLGGREPEALDIRDNAMYPFLPVLKATQQGTVPFAEVSRSTFAMPSGGRREVCIELPGLSYDPLNQQLIKPPVEFPPPGGQQRAAMPSIFDEYTYAVMMSVCGVVCTNEILDTAAATTYNVGDIVSRCDIQFYCTYTENISACAYSYEKKPIMYSAGIMVDTLPNVATTQTPVTMLDQGSAVRLPRTSSTGYAGTNLTADFNTV